MERFNEEQGDLIDLGSVTTETKGTFGGELEDGASPIKRPVNMGLSDD